MCSISSYVEIMNLSGHLECAFITVDPERDSSDVMQKYLKGEFIRAQTQSHTCTGKQYHAICMVSLVAWMNDTAIEILYMIWEEIVRVFFEFLD